MAMRTARTARCGGGRIQAGETHEVRGLLEVFEEYCREEHRVARIAWDHKCCKLTVLRPLKMIRERTGMNPKEMRRYDALKAWTNAVKRAHKERNSLRSPTRIQLN